MPPSGELYRRLKAIKDAQVAAKAGGTATRPSGAPGTISSGAPGTISSGAPGTISSGAPGTGRSETKSSGNHPATGNPLGPAGQDGAGRQDGPDSGGARPANHLPSGSAGTRPEPDGAASLAGQGVQTLDKSWEECATGVWRRVESINLESASLPPGLRALLADPAARTLLPGFLSRFHFDTETTGLSGGAGTRIFLLGWSRLLAPDPQSSSGWTLEIRQYFLADFPWEPEFLALVEEDLVRYGPADPHQPGMLVSYNGASFDLPLCRTRWIMNGRPWPEPCHVDCLHPARRLWKSLHASCSLGHLESVVLGVERHGDPGGALVPQLYFSWLRNSGTQPFQDALSGVLSHHRQDLLSLFGLDLAMEWLRRQTLQEGTKVLAWVNPRLAILALPGWTLGIDPAGLWREFSARDFAGGELCVPALAREAWDIFRDPWWGKRLAPWVTREESWEIYKEIWQSSHDLAALRTCLVYLEHHVRKPGEALTLLDEALAGRLHALAAEGAGQGRVTAGSAVLEDLARRRERLARKAGSGGARDRISP